VIKMQLNRKSDRRGANQRSCYFKWNLESKIRMHW